MPHFNSRVLALGLLLFFIACKSAGSEENDEFGSGLDLSTPYVNESDIAFINEAFSLHDNAPWGFKHVGIDFFPAESLKAFRTSCAGKVDKVELWKNGEKWQVNIIISCNAEFILLYSFEPFTQDEKTGQDQLAQISIKEGVSVEKNEKIGNLIITANGGHVHFSLKQNNEFICPKAYFTEAAYQSIMDIIHKKHPDWEMCY